MKKLLTAALLLAATIGHAQLSEQPTLTKSTKPKVNFIIFPNPVAVGEFTQLKVVGDSIVKLDLVIRDLLGRPVQEWHTSKIKSARFSFNNKGVYLADIRFTIGRKTYFFNRKIFVR